MLSKLALTVAYASLLVSIIPSTTDAIEPLTIHQINRRRRQNLNLVKQQESHDRRADHHDYGRVEEDGVTEDVEELYFEQRLDHFKWYPSGKDLVHQNNTTSFSFSQRYFYSSRYVHDKDDDDDDVHDKEESNTAILSTLDHDDANPILPKTTERRMLLRKGYKQYYKSQHSQSKNKDTFAFLCVGGEGPSLTKHVLVDSVHCTGDMIELASKLFKEKHANVHLFALEHRYYGNSYPAFFDGSSAVSNDNLVYLSSRQALMDVANFVQIVKDQYALNDNVKFITFGGSYPGMMAGWSRLKFPHLIYGSVSNSAPVQVVLDFHEYNEVVAASLKNPMVGGSDECYEIVRNGHEEIISMLEKDTDEDRKTVADKFNICDGPEVLLDKKNVNAFLGDGVIYIPAQENDPTCDGDLCNIAKVCDNLTSSALPSSMDKIAAIARQRQGIKSSCTNINWEDMISFLSSDEAKMEGTRSWLWQTCTEMGFYQTCPDTSQICPYGRGYHEVEQDLEICERAFGVGREFVSKNVQETMNNYGGWHMAGSRILSVNGDIDPWSALSMTHGGVNTTDLPSYWSIGASHHFWTHEVKESDGERIQKTREFIYDWVTNILYSEES